MRWVVLLHSQTSPPCFEVALFLYFVHADVRNFVYVTHDRSSADPPPQRWTGVSVDDAEAAPAVILQTDDFDEVAF